MGFNYWNDWRICLFKMAFIKIFLVGLLLNFVENTILLLFFKVPFSKIMLISSLIFALILSIVYKLFERKLKT